MCNCFAVRVFESLTGFLVLGKVSGREGVGECGMGGRGRVQA
jgi:hypothetical protein